MSDEEFERLLGGYATNTLSEAERKVLFEAALEDQNLFNAMEDEEALRDVLADQESRAEIERALRLPAREVAAPPWYRRAWVLGLAGSLAATALLAVVLVRWNAPEPRATVALSKKAKDEPAPPPALDAAPVARSAPAPKMAAKTAPMRRDVPAPAKPVVALVEEKRQEPAKQETAAKEAEPAPVPLQAPPAQQIASQIVAAQSPGNQAAPPGATSSQDRAGGGANYVNPAPAAPPSPRPPAAAFGRLTAPPAKIAKKKAGPAFEVNVLRDAAAMGPSDLIEAGQSVEFRVRASVSGSVQAFRSGTGQSLTPSVEVAAGQSVTLPLTLPISGREAIVLRLIAGDGSTNTVEVLLTPGRSPEVR